MPTYEYRREDGSTFDYFQKMSDTPLEVCPDTGQKVYRVITGGSGVVYKGEGWYVKEYKNAGKSPDSTSENKESASEPAPVSAETKTEKPVAKSDQVST